MTTRKAGAAGPVPATGASRRQPKRKPGPAAGPELQVPAAMVDRLRREHALTAEAQQRLDDMRSGMKRELAQAEAQVLDLLQLGDMPWQYAVDHLKANPPSATTILLLIDAARRAAVSDSSRDRAHKRNGAARAEVVEAWDTRSDGGQSKDAFAREWSARLRKAGVGVTPETIADRWLKGR